MPTRWPLENMIIAYHRRRDRHIRAIVGAQNPVSQRGEPLIPYFFCVDELSSTSTQTMCSRIGIKYGSVVDIRI